MLRELIIRDILLIEHLELEVHPGLNVLTGETRRMGVKRRS